MYTLKNKTIDSYYQQALRRGWLGKIWSRISGKSRDLIDLRLLSNSQLQSHYSEPGIVSVQIDQIQGSESRIGDFDRNFYPRQSHTRERWQKIASLLLAGRNLPPIELVYVGDLYFVRDGHHRVSAARVLGQLSIDAQVVRYQVEGPLPWELQEDIVSHSIIRELAARFKSAMRSSGAIKPRSPNTSCNPQQSEYSQWTAF